MPTTKSLESEIRRLTGRLEKLAHRIESRVLTALNEGAEILAERARDSLREGGRSGRVYSTPQGPHQASAPGEAPAALSGRLGESIAVEPGGTEGEVHVTADTEYAAALEFGTRDSAPRPFLGPALDEGREEIKGRIKKAAGKAAPGTGV